MANVVVCCRFRPPSRNERETNSPIVGRAANPQTASLATGKAQPELFNFDYVFDVGSSQEEVFDHTAKHLITEVFGGYNATIFAYGQTGTGKTHTMMGEVKTPQKGIIPRLVESIFNGIEEAPLDIEFTVKLSYIEIYNEKVRDLLATAPGKDNLRIREGAKGVWIEDVTESYVGTNEQVLDIMNQGQSARSIAATNMNAESSRSHSVFILTLGQRNTKTESKKASKLILVDLAGSEKIAKTGAEGKTLKEAQHINKSLSALGNVINALTSAGKKHVPYRDSKLTRLLSDSLGGNSKTTLIVTCSPCGDNIEESVSTLRFGTRAKSIKNKPVVNQEKSVAELTQLLNTAQSKIDAQSQIIRLLEKDVVELRNCIAAVDPKHLRVPMPLIKRHTLDEIMTGIKIDKKAESKEDDGPDTDEDEDENKEAKTAVTVSAPSPLSSTPAAAPVANTGPAATSVPPSSPAPTVAAPTPLPASTPIKLIIGPGRSPSPLSPGGAATGGDHSRNSSVALTPPPLPRGMSIFVGAPASPSPLGGSGGSVHDAVIDQSLAMKAKIDEMEAKYKDTLDQLKDRQSDLEESKAEHQRLTAQLVEAQAKGIQDDGLRTEATLLRSKLANIEREHALALRAITDERNELQRQLAAKEEAIAAATAAAPTEQKDAAAGAAALAITPRLAALTSLSTGGSLASSGDAMEVMRTMLKKKSDQNTELVQVNEGRKDQIAMLEKVLEENKGKVGEKEKEIKSLRTELESTRLMCKKLLESGLYWRELRKSEMGQAGPQGRVGVIQGGGTTVVTLRGGARVHGAPGAVASPLAVIRGGSSGTPSPGALPGSGHQRKGSLGMTPQRPSSALSPSTPVTPAGIPTSSSANSLKTPPPATTR